MGFTTRAIHSRHAKADGFGALRYPIYQNAAFEFESAEDLEAVFTGKKGGHTYTRASNPTVEELEIKAREVSSSLGVLAVSSGMAAITNTLLALLKSGDNIVTTNRLFGHTLSLFQNTFEDFGVEVRFVDILDLQSVKNAIDERTKILFVETVSNPELVIPDFEELSKIAKQNNTVFVADTTMTPFYLFDSKKHGVDIEVLSATKYISGGGTTVGGLIIDNGTFDWSKFENLKKFYNSFGPNAFLAKLRKQSFRNTGACLAPLNAYMLSLGLETLALRADRSFENTIKLAEFLSAHPKVKSVNYPHLKGNKYYENSQKYFLFPGSVFTFDVEDKQTAYELMNKLKIVRRSTNIQDNKTLAIAPYHTIYAEYTAEQKASFGLREGTLRISVGIEDTNDLISDFKQALA